MDLDYTNRYENNIDHEWRLVTNPNVSTINLYVPVMDFPPQDWNPTLGQYMDKLYVNGIGWRDPLYQNQIFMSTPTAAPASGIPMRFFTDGQYNAYGFSIESANIKCTGGGSSSVVSMQPLMRYDGLLLGQGDTIFFSFPGGPEDIYVYTTGKEDTTKDVDLYWRTGSLPTKDQYTGRSVINNTGNEALKIPGGTSGQTHFFAVTAHTANGPTTFSIRASRARQAEHKTLKFGIRSGTPVTTLQLDQMRANARETMNRFFAATEGQIVVNKVEIYNQGPDAFSGCKCGGVSCDVCFTDLITANAHCTLPYIYIPVNFLTNNVILTHEIGHCTLFFLDEYDNHAVQGGGTCHNDVLDGHTLMADQNRRTNFCTDIDHKRDESPVGHVCAGCAPSATCNGPAPGSSCATCQFISNYSNWGALINNVVTPVTKTPDADAYANHQGLSSLFVVQNM